MAQVFDLHVHTERHSECSRIEPAHLVRLAVRAGLDGLVITEHHYQWSPDELRELAREADAPGFVLLAGFEYTSTCGDILVYGLHACQVSTFEPFMDPGEALAAFQAHGAACVAAHPTRAGMGFDTRIRDLAFDAIEVQSVNMLPHEQSLALNLAQSLGLRPMAASDAHRLADVGAYRIELEVPVQTMAHLQEALRHGKFHITAAGERHPLRIERV